MSATVVRRLGTTSVDRARNAVLVTFLVNGVAFAAWASRIPDVKAQLGLSAGNLGLLLLSMSLGAVVGLPGSGWLAGRYGSTNAVRLGVAAVVVGYAAVATGVDGLESVPLVAVGLFAAGLGIGVWDVGMNLEGAAVEQLHRRTLMPWFHAAFSIGTVMSALVGAGLSALAAPVGLHLVVAAVLVAAVCMRATTKYLPRDVEAAVEEKVNAGARVSWAWRDARTLLVGMLVFIAAFTEGTANDWLSVALVEGHDVPTWAGVLGFATFLSFMTLGRLVGPMLLDRFGRVPLLRVLFAAAGLGSLLVVFGSVSLAYLGAAIWGFGVSLGFPVGMSAAADDPRTAAARMSVVATIGYSAFLCGPPLLGFLGDDVGILRALLVVGCGVVVAILVLPAAREPRDAD